MNTIKTCSSLRCIGILLITLFLPSLSFAGVRDDRSIEIQGQYTLVLGSGAAVIYNLGDHLTFGINYYSAVFEGDGENEENDETYKAEFSTSELFIRFYFFEGAGLYISGAAVARNWEISIDGYDSDIGGSTIPGNYTVTATWPSTGIAYGLGYNWSTAFGLTLGAHFGMLTGGEPELKGETDASGVTQEQVDQHVDEVSEDEEFGEKYNTVPLVRVHLGFSF